MANRYFKRGRFLRERPRKVSGQIARKERERERARVMANVAHNEVTKPEPTVAEPVIELPDTAIEEISDKPSREELEVMPWDEFRAFARSWGVKGRKRSKMIEDLLAL